MYNFVYRTALFRVVEHNAYKNSIPSAAGFAVCLMAWLGFLSAIKWVNLLCVTIGSIYFISFSILTRQLQFCIFHTYIYLLDIYRPTKKCCEYLRASLTSSSSSSAASYRWNWCAVRCLRHSMHFVYIEGWAPPYKIKYMKLIIWFYKFLQLVW